MSDLNHQIHLALRTAAGHARAANDAMSAADKTYEMKMKSAGAALYEAWGLAVRAQPDFQGRKIDDKALVRIYESTKARPWWDKHLATIKVDGKPADREWAKRTMQWHLDPDAARARRAQAVVRSTAHHKRVKEAAARGARTPQARSEPTTGEMRQVRKAAELGMGYGTGPDRMVIRTPGSQLPPGSDAQSAMDEIDRLLARIRRAAARHAVADRVKLEQSALLIEELAESVEEL